MDRSSSTSSNASTGSKSGSSAGPFAYQTRLLERTSSGSRGGGSIARSLSQASKATFPAPPGSPTTPTGTRRWTPSHRVGSSLDTVRGKWEERTRTEATLESRTPSSPSRPTSLFPPRTPSSPEIYKGDTPLPPVRPSSSAGPSFNRSNSPEKSTSTYTPPPTAPSPSPMSPTPYRSSYMSSKKASTYGENLIVGRRLGRHLPRIASGDGPDEIQDDNIVQDVKRNIPESPHARHRDSLAVETSERVRPRSIVVPGVTDTDDVAGIPGRLRLSRDKAPSTPTSPLPSDRLGRGLWADTQRHHLQAYEYLCHVGEAQQWIEGCLGEELGFGVVELEEGLRNGVVLAKLVRAFQGESVVRRIYEAPKLDFRHSDNINYFFNFVRAVGLPEGFIFELTDLYEKKNLPKVIYCIHALSHLLARRGMAERIGNLLGRLKFSDDQLQKTQKGLKDAGVAMPNFGNVGKELAKEINEEPEVEVETDDERRDRLLLENEDSITALQSFARGFLVRKAQATQRVRLRLSEKNIVKLQAQCRGLLSRRIREHRRQEEIDLIPWVTMLQAQVRGTIARRRWYIRLKRIKGLFHTMVNVQAQARGVLQRRRYARLKAALKQSSISVVKLQSLARAHVTRKAHHDLVKSFTTGKTPASIIAFQSHARGALVRRAARKQLSLIKSSESRFVALQAHCRGIITRRQIRKQLAKLEDATAVVIRMQAASRTYLARKRLLTLIRGLRKATPIVVGFQARARANLARQQHHNINKALSEVKVVTAVGGFQALARAALARNRHREQTKQLEFVAPDVVGLQATARGVIARQEYCAWRDHLRRSHPVASILQAMLRGVLQRRGFRAKMNYYRSNLDKVVKIQSLFRAKETREQYRQLTLGKNVNVGTIKNFVHLLDDSEADFQEEIKVERLRKKVVEHIRENQALEHDVSDLDVIIALVVQNVKSFEELVKVRRRHGADSAAAHAARASVLAAHGDPFAGPSTLDHGAKRKLELYQQLFYLLQTRGEYLSRLFLRISLDSAPEKNRRLTERVVLTLFGYGQDRREDYLLLKLFQLSTQEEIITSTSLPSIVHDHPMYINIAVHYLRPKQTTYIRETLQNVIREIVGSDDLDLEADPAMIYRARVELEELRSGEASLKSKDVPFYQALNDPDTRAEYIRHLQVLQWWTEAFLNAITQSTRKMPYGIRFMAREALHSLRDKFPDASEEAYAACIGRLVYYRYINPAIVTPETFEIVANTIDINARKNLAQISKVLTQITSGSEFGEDNSNYVPINDFVRKAIKQMSAWLLQVAEVPDAESQFHAHEFLDATVQPKPIYISPNEVYAMHTLLSEYHDYLAPNRDDTLRVILNELDGVPNLGNDELNDARDKAITLELTNRFAHVRDPHADEKALWVQAKRGVLAILRVQPAQDLVESLMRPVTDDEEAKWESIIEDELENEQVRQQPRRMPSAHGGDSAYRLEDIRSLTFKEVKAHAIFFLLELEKQGKITRNDGFQGILDAIAGDVRSKHRKRLQRQQEMDSMNEALRHLAERKKYFQEQIDSYHDYIEASMATMQRGKGKKRFILPFTKQYFHLRDLQRSGKSPQFGSFKYSARDLYEKGILLSIDQFSPRQFDKIDVIISSNKAGIFTIEVFNNTLGITNRLATQDVRMEELLQAQFKNRASLSLFNGLAKMNLNLLLYQINKKFYV